MPSNWPRPGVANKFLAAATQAVVTAFGAGISAEAGADIEQAVQAGMAAGAREAKAEAQADAAGESGADAPNEPCAGPRARTTPNLRRRTRSAPSCMSRPAPLRHCALSP